MMKYCNKCDKKGMHGYRIFLWIVLAVIIVAGIWYVICGCRDEIPTDGTLVDDMKNAKHRCMAAAKNTMEECKEDIKDGYCNCKEDLSNAVDDLCSCKEDTKNAMKDCGEDVKNNMEACKCENQESGSSEA